MADTFVNIYHVYLHVDAAAPSRQSSNETLRKAHHHLFLKIQQAQDQLLKNDSGDDLPAQSCTAIHGGPISLHQANLDFKAKLRERREAALEEKRKAENSKARQKQILNAKAKIVAKAKADRAAEKLVAQRGGNITRKDASVGAHAHGEKKAQTHDKHGFLKTTSSSAAIKAKKREKKEHVKTLRTNTENECNEQLKIAQNDSYVATANAVAYENSHKFLKDSSGNVSLSTQTGALSKETAEKWIEPQNKIRAYRERARLEREGVCVSENSPEWESLILRVRAELIEEAEQRFGLDVSSVLAFYCRRGLN